jgi:hypothetical protein
LNEKTNISAKNEPKKSLAAVEVPLLNLLVLPESNLKKQITKSQQKSKQKISPRTV